MNTDSPSEFKSSRHFLQTHHLSQATSWKTLRHHKRAFRSSALCGSAQGIRLSQKDTGRLRAVEPCLPRMEPLPSRQQSSQCSPHSHELAPCWKSRPDLKLISLSSPVTQTVAQRLSHSSCGCPRMLMFESKQSKVPAKNQLRGQGMDAQQRLVPGPVSRAGSGLWSHPLASGSGTVGTPSLVRIC